jgi:hypothetical protein
VIFWLAECSSTASDEHVAIHTRSEVAEFAGQIRSSSAEQLIARFDPVRMNQLNVYCAPWDDTGRDYILQFLEPFRKCIIAADEGKHAMIIVIA